MRKLEHCNIVKLKYFFYSSGEKVSAKPSTARSARNYHFPECVEKNLSINLFFFLFQFVSFVTFHTSSTQKCFFVLISSFLFFE